MRLKKALFIAESCQRGEGPDDPRLLAEALVSNIRSRVAPGRLLGLLGRLYTVTAGEAGLEPLHEPIRLDVFQ